MSLCSTDVPAKPEFIQADFELFDYLLAMVQNGQASEFVIVVETPAGSRLSFMSQDGRKLAGWAYRKGADQ